MPQTHTVPSFRLGPDLPTSFLTKTRVNPTDPTHTPRENNTPDTDIHTHDKNNTPNPQTQTNTRPAVKGYHPHSCRRLCSSALESLSTVDSRVREPTVGFNSSTAGGRLGGTELEIASGRPEIAPDKPEIAPSSTAKAGSAEPSSK